MWYGLKPMNESFTIKFWGVRGSIPVPGASTVEHGGNTTCLEVSAAGRKIILDAGTGIRLLGRNLREAVDGQSSDKEITLLLTHTHWDHIQGLPFFIPQLKPGTRLRILGCEGAREGLATLLTRQMESPFFPIPLRGFPANIEIEEMAAPEFHVGQVHGSAFPANHPGTCMGYRLEFKGHSIVFFPDNEPHLGKLRHSLESTPAEEASAAKEKHARMVNFVHNADVLVMDAQYDRDEYASHVGWGHGCVDDVVDLSIEAGVRHLVLFHHDPDHTDAKLRQMEQAARQRVRAAGSHMKVTSAVEGATLQIAEENV